MGYTGYTGGTGMLLLCQKYEGRSINKLHNDISLLVFKICKFWNIGYVL